jgi:hypothetical protein
VKKLLALLALVVLACGKRGDPKPPVPVIPQATSDLVVTQRAGNVILSWSYPSLTTAGRSLPEIRRISVFRSVEPLPVAPGGRDPNTLLPGDIDPTLPQPIALFAKVPPIPKAQFEKLSERIESIEKANLAGATVGAKLVYTDTPPFRSEDGRPVRLTYAVVTEGVSARSESSNLATIVPLPVAVPPASLTATAKAEGVVLTWVAPGTSVVPNATPIISGYNLYRSAPGAAVSELDPPINTAPIRTATFTDAPPYGEHDYRVSAVAAAGPPLVQSDPSAPARATFKDLVPPPAPTGLTPLVETNAVRLIWEPVSAPDLAGYRIYRSEGVGHGADIRLAGTFPIVMGPLAETTWVDPEPVLGIAYRYGVASLDQSGNESEPVWTPWLVAPKTP